MTGMVCCAGRSTTTGAGGVTVAATGTSIATLKPARSALSRPKLACSRESALFLVADGRVAQRESTALTWQGPQVQSLSRPPSTNPLKDHRLFLGNRGTLQIKISFRL